MKPLPPRLREALPFALRVGLRRAPHLARWALRPAAPPRAPRTEGWHLQAQRRSPLRRQSTAYEDDWQARKEHNVARVAALLDGVTLAPGETFSWHQTVGPPIRANGFVPGPELHNERLRLGGGGGACQAANMVFQLAAEAGMRITERHRHGLDLFPDDGRDVPFGCGATVFYPHRDLRFDNPLPHTLTLRVRVEGQELRGEAWLDGDPGFQVELIERDARFERRGEDTWRLNRVVRRIIMPDGVREEPLVENRGRVLYSLPAPPPATPPEPPR